MPRRTRGERRSRSRHVLRTRRLEVTRLEARQMLSGDAFWSASPETPAEAAYQFATDYDHDETLVVMVAPDADAASASPAAEGKLVEQFALNALTAAAPKAHEDGVALLDATGDVDDESTLSTADQAAVDPAAVASVAYVPDDTLTTHDVSAILQVARTDLAADTASSPPDAAQQHVAEAIVLVREPDGEVAGVGVVFGSAAYHDHDPYDPYGPDANADSLLAASLTLAASNPRAAENTAAKTAFEGDEAAEGSLVVMTTSAAPDQMVEVDADTPESADREPGPVEVFRTEADVFPAESEISRGTTAARAMADSAREPGADQLAQVPLNHAARTPSVHDSARKALFASLAENAGDFGAWLQLYALPRNLVSLENAIQSLLAECEDVDQAIGHWLLEPGAQPWLEWATVALVAAEAARRRSRRQQSELASSTRDAEQLLHLFPELFGLAYGA